MGGRMDTLTHSAPGKDSNTSSPILMLPYDLLFKIGFEFFKATEPSWAWDEQSKIHRLQSELPEYRTGFFPLTHICRSLRVLYVSTPQFWTTINLRSPLAHLCFQRSGNLPLRIICGGDKDPAGLPLYRLLDMVLGGRQRKFSGEISQHIKAQLLGVLERIERLEISDWDVYVSRLLKCINGRQLPRLCVLMVESLSRGEIRPFLLSVQQAADNLISSQQRTLRLQNASIPYISPLYAGLQSLELISPQPRDIFPTVESFLYVLRQCPQLVCLRLEFAGPMGTFHQYASSQMCSLPHLSSLTLRHNLGNVAGLMSRIDCPAVRSLTILTGPHHPDSTQNVWRFILSNNRLFDKIRSQKKWRIKIEEHDPYVECGEDEEDSTEADLPLIRFKIGCRVINPANLRQLICRDMVEAFGNSTCEDLTVEVSTSAAITFLYHDWGALYTGFPSVRTLRLPNCHQASLLLQSILYGFPESSHILPKLQKLELLRFGGLISHHRAGAHVEALSSELKGILLRRTEYGFPVRCLVVELCEDMRSALLDSKPDSSSALQDLRTAVDIFELVL